LVAGLLALSVWLGSNAATALFQGWQNWVFDHHLRGEPATLDQFLAEEKQRIVGLWGRLNPRDNVPSPVPESLQVRPSVPDPGVIGRLTIPRLHLSAIVREGVGGNTLSVALGHIPGTALPGTPGNIGVAGHRDTLFRALREIRKDDRIRFESLAGTYVYRVEETEIVSPRNVGVLRVGPQSELTLVTCYPFYYVGAAPDRFIVRARQISPNQHSARGTPPSEKLAERVHGSGQRRPLSGAGRWY
jgi:sortase A